jgi:hypothetical protein
MFKYIYLLTVRFFLSLFYRGIIVRVLHSGLAILILTVRFFLFFYRGIVRVLRSGLPSTLPACGSGGAATEVMTRVRKVLF